jgi:hypothetical protein
MRNPKELTREEVIHAASRFRWTRKMPKWRVLVQSRELPARPLVLEAAGVAPNDPTNSHQAVAILERLGFETRYAAERHHAENSQTADYQGAARFDSIVDAFSAIAKEVPDKDWANVPADFSKNVDRYLYRDKSASGTKR